MLLELRVQNLLLVERAELLLGPGLNVITGETGVGKTMLTHALDLLLGCKPRRDLVRPGAGEAYVEGVFDTPVGLTDAAEFEQLREQVDLEGSELVLARRVTAQGRSRAYLQGRSVSAPDLQVVGAALVAFYGQHEHRKLTLASAQLDVLDGFCGEQHVAARRAYEREWTRSLALRRELEGLRERAGARERDLDLLDFEIEEIEQAAPGVDEERRLEQERQRLESVESLRLASASALGALETPSDMGVIGVADRLAGAAAELERVREQDPSLAVIAERCGALVEEARDLARELGDYGGSLEADPARLSVVGERLGAFAHLKRKHGGTIEAVLAHAEHARQERDRLANIADETARVEQQLEAVQGQLARLAGELSAARRKAAAELSASVCAELDELAMPDASFEVALVPAPPGSSDDAQLGSKGAETVEFSIAPNPGVPAGPLREIASGGELSRVMLALMSVESAASGSPTVVFDEVDAGVGGGTARAVGARLRALAASRQAICITHLPQVAALASCHFRVTKGAPAGRGATVAALASTSVDRLEGDQIVEELCRMLGADAGDGAARRHVEKLLEAA